MEYEIIIETIMNSIKIELLHSENYTIQISRWIFIPEEYYYVFQIFLNVEGKEKILNYAYDVNYSEKFRITLMSKLILKLKEEYEKNYKGVKGSKNV